MIFSPSAVVLFFFLASIGTPTPVPPTPGEAVDKGPIYCNIGRFGYENFALPWRIKQGEDYLFKKGGHYVSKALQTELVSCSYNCGISVMNTITSDITIPYYEIADLARDVRVACDNTLNAVNGERYNNAGWRVIVHSYQEC